MTSGLVQTSSEGSHLCKFQLTVTYKGTEQDLEFIETDKIELAATVMITRPADKIELKSKCSGSAECVFTVKESDVATWSGLTFQGATQIRSLTAVVLNFNVISILPEKPIIKCCFTLL